MNWYDGEWNRWYGPEPRRRGREGGGSFGFRHWGGEGRGPEGYGGRGYGGAYDEFGRGGYRGGEGFRSRRAPGWTQEYDRGVYGGSYPTFGGVPGGLQRGMYYGESRGARGYGYGGEYRGGGRGGHGRALEGWDYGGEYAREPFMPEEAYRRHPEYGARHRTAEWSGERSSNLLYEVGMEDDEIRQAVRQNLYQDDYLDADRIEVDVNGGVVTLTGEVDEYLEARYAWDDAWDTPGVRGVVNHLTVRTDLRASEHEVLPQSAGGGEEEG